MFKLKLKLKLVITFVVALMFATGVFVYYKYNKIYDYSENVRTYSELIKKDPENCFYLEQLAINYSFMHSFDKAIEHYDTVINKCPDNPAVFFQIGVCYFVMGNKAEGIKFMDSAIAKAYDQKDVDLALMYQKEKSAWVNNDKNLETFRNEINKKPNFIEFIKGLLKR